RPRGRRRRQRRRTSSSPLSYPPWCTSWLSRAMIRTCSGAQSTITCTSDPPRVRPPPRAARGGDVLHRVGRAVRFGGAGRLGGPRGRVVATGRDATRLQYSRNAAHRRAGLDAARRGWLLPVGETGVRPLLGVLERLALLDLFAARHGDLPGAVHSVPAVLRTGAVAARSLARGVGVDLGRDLAQPPRDGRCGDGVGLVRGDGAAALRGAGRCGERALDRATGYALPRHAVPCRRQLVPGSAGLGRFTEHLELLGLGQRLDDRRGDRARDDHVPAGARARAAARAGGVSPLGNPGARAHTLDVVD